MKINISCETCKKVHSVKRTNEIPAHVTSMGCNWCPECEDRAEDYYQEWYNESDASDGSDDIPVNQLVMPFIIDEITESVQAPNLTTPIGIDR